MNARATTEQFGTGKSEFLSVCMMPSASVHESKEGDGRSIYCDELLVPQGLDTS
jgi:hypothetical protein